jgi:hypothetical protein
MDKITRSFFKTQQERALALSAESDVLDLHAFDLQRYLARFHCKGLVRSEDGEIKEANCFDVGIWLPEDYIRVPVSPLVLTWLAPRAIFHPNVSPPLMCIGEIQSGTPLHDLLFRIFEVITYQNYTVVEHDALSRPACAWARRHASRFPVDTQPLKRRFAARGTTE